MSQPPRQAAVTSSLAPDATDHGGDAHRHPFLDRRHEHWLLASMLLVLHTALDSGIDTQLASALMVTHLGLFFLWQPIWQREQRVDLPALAVTLVLVGAMLWLTWWTVFAWLVLLIGILAGRSFSTRRERYVYMLSLAMLVSELLINCTAQLFLAKPLAPGITQSFRLGLYLAPAVLYAMPPIIAPPRDPFPVDFFRGITFALLTALLAVFSVAMTLRLGLEYPLALIATLMALGVFLFFLSWITTPGAGSIGLLAVWEKSVLNIGTRFESWLANVSNLASQRPEADDFLDDAVAALVDIPWIAGAAWVSSGSHGMHGHSSPHALALETEALSVTLYTERSVSSALLIHCRLLVQVLGHFYVAKQREREQAGAAHLRAVHETGARVTHDIKNLLQSLNTLAAALQSASDAHQEQRGFELLKRRLPDIAQRLKVALEKLQRPQSATTTLVPAARWWRELGERLGDDDIALEARIDDGEQPLPGECLDSIVDNLVDNARHKLAAGQAGRLVLKLVVENGTLRLEVRDDGQAIDEHIARQLFQRPVPSRTGLGIGLYQAAELARRHGCGLRLAANVDGEVCFELTCARSAAATAAVPPTPCG
ncbi:MAG: HAMP domain-containing histidine kinase [Proteobacteria bacterium]|nr:HAMP domain-containing histidine kinase [Pseudomonadota bacterium]